MGRGGKGKFSFRRTNSHARGARNLDEVSPSSASAISRGNEMKKWRANSHNKADNRAIKITFARPKKAKRNQKKKGGERNENFASHPSTWSLGSARWKISSLRKPPSLLHARTCNTSPPLLFFSAQRTHAFSKHEFYAYIYKEWYTYVGRKRRRRVERCWSVLDWGSQATSQPASRLADQPTIPHSIRRFSLSLPCERNEVSPGVLSPGNIVWQGPPRDNISDVC